MDMKKPMLFKTLFLFQLINISLQIFVNMIWIAEKNPELSVYLSLISLILTLLFAFAFAGVFVFSGVFAGVFVFSGVFAGVFVFAFAVAVAFAGAFAVAVTQRKN